ncbi:MAG TPA: DUF6272 family protein [Taishania sp.]|nr:DUF6272 family protein [Taishania sp.]
MLKVKEEIQLSVKTIYEHFVQSILDERDSEILLKYEGEFATSLIRVLAENVEFMLLEFGESRQLVKRMFSIIIEGLQNIYLHGGIEDGLQKAFLIISKQTSKYTITMGNVISKSEQKSLNQTIDEINNMPDEELKELYITKLKNGFLNSKGGAGLGLVTMRMKSNQPLEYSFHSLKDNQTFMIISVNVAN